MSRISSSFFCGVGALLSACQLTAELDPLPEPEGGPEGGPEADPGSLASARAPAPSDLPASCQDDPDPAMCCAAGEVLVTGTALGDALDLTASAGAHCVFGLGGDDWVGMGSAGGRALLGSFDDAFDGAGGAELVMGGLGHDTIRTFGGNDELHGGEGDDILDAGSDADLVVPGPGLDTVDAGLGDDTVVVRHLCEVSRDELLDGGRNYDVLVSPVPLAELEAQGVTVQGFEEVVVEPNPCASTCADVPDCGANGACTADADGEAVCECDPGFTGPECDIPCEDGVACELKVFYHGNGTVNGALMRGGTLFDASNEAEVAQGLEQWFAAHHELLSLDPVELLDVFDELVPAEPQFREHGQLRTLTLEQTYRGYRIFGPEAQITATYAPGKGVIAFMGTVADPREDYQGLTDTVSQVLAEQAILDRWLEVGDVTEGVSVAAMELVAVPQAKSMGWYGRLERANEKYGYVVVPAAPDVTGGVPPTVLGYGLLRHESPGDLVSIDVLGPPFTDDIAEATETTLWSSLPTGGPLQGSTFTPQGVQEGIKLGSSRVQIYDAQNMALGTSPAALVSPDATFDAGPADEVPWSMQSNYLHILAALKTIESVKQGSWDHRDVWKAAGWLPEMAARLVVFVRAGSGSCPDAGACYDTHGYPEIAKWFDLDHEFYRATPGGALTDQPTIALSVLSPGTTHHELGHFFDDFSGAGMTSTNGTPGMCIPNPMSPADCVPGCHPDTIDEAPPLAETIANMVGSALTVSSYGAIGFDDDCYDGFYSASWRGTLTPAPSSACATAQADITQFADTRPTSPELGQDFYCAKQPGYRQYPVLQAWWSMLHGKVCDGQAPWTCDDITGLPSPARVGLEALQYGLSVSNHQWYEMFIENVGIYYACQYGPSVHADYVQVMSNHGLMEPGTMPPVCPDLCGDGIEGPNEACDDGNTSSGDGCSSACTVEGGGGGGVDGTPCDSLYDYPGGTGLTDRPMGSAQTLEEELYYHWCGPDPALTCVVENEQFVCRECGPEKRPGCYCELDEDCMSLGPGAKCYGPGLHGPEFGCFIPADAPVYACEEPCQTHGKVCAWDPSEFMSGTCFNEYCLEPGPDFACERDAGVECFPEAELCYLPGEPECESDGAPCDGLAGVCSLRWSGQVYECCHEDCLIPFTAG